MIKNLQVPTGIIIFILVLTGFSTYGQDQKISNVFRIETRDGNGYTGEVVSRDSVKVVFRAEKLGQIEISQSDIITILPLDTNQVKKGKYWFPNPQSSRYFFSPNGYGLKKGEGYYQNIWVLMNSFAVGLSNYVSIGGGLIPLFLFAGSPTPAWITAKISIPVVKDQFNLGAGILAGNALGASNSDFGIFYGIATAGSRDRNISLGIGYGFSGGSVSSSPMINLNAMYRVGVHSYLLTENYLFTNGSESTLMIMFGGRQIIHNAGLDYGLVVPAASGIGSFVAIPWLGITIPFGDKAR